MKKHPKLISLFQSALNTPMTSDNVCNLLFRIASLKTPYYRKNMTFFLLITFVTKELLQTK